MTPNSFIYTVTYASLFLEWQEHGFPGTGNVSTNGELRMGDKLDNEQIVFSSVPPKPSYVLEPMENWPFLTHRESHILLGYFASEIGGDDGFSPPSKS